MKLMTCPMNGPRSIAEFQWLGAVQPDDDPQGGALVERLFFAPNPLGVLREWWRHTPSNTVFIAERHLTTNEILCTYFHGAGTDSTAGAAQ